MQSRRLHQVRRLFFFILVRGRNLTPQSSSHGSSTDDEEEGLSSSNSRTGSSSVSPAYSIANYRPNLRINPLGTERPHFQTALIKAAAPHYPSVLSFPALWFGRSRYLVQGTHLSGNVESVRVADVRENLVLWERRPQNQGPLRRLAGLLWQLRALVATSPGRACVAVCQGGTRWPLELTVFVSDGREEALPNDLLGRFWDQ